MGWQTLSAGFQVDLEYIYHAEKIRQRPKAVRGFVRPAVVGKGRKSGGNTPLATKHLFGDTDGKIPNTEGGHLIGLDLGGVDRAENIVPMYGVVNRSKYRNIERKIAEIAARPGKTAMLVDVTYPDLSFTDPPDQRIPLFFDIYLYEGEEDLAKVTVNRQHLRYSVFNTKSNPTRMEISDGDIALRRELIRIRDGFDGAAWRVERERRDYADYDLPPVDNRPNAWLDYLIYSNANVRIARAMLSKVPAGELTVGPRWPFAPQQRMFVQLANRLTQPDERKGECWSDSGDADPIKTALTAHGTDDGIHVDHIVPKASGGPNIYSNAAVVSALANKRKGR